MKLLCPTRLLLAALLFGLHLPLSAETYSGVVRLIGEVQNDAKPGSLSMRFEGQLTGRGSGDRVNVTGGGLLRSTTDAITDTTFTGRLKTNLRLTSRPGEPGKLVRSNDVEVVRVTKRYLILPMGRIRLERPINGARGSEQEIRGVGRITLRG
ncbi:MAG: hypothetical protein B9S36_05695 [Verrucomicrobiia bacterium Tous-C2TDCM]|nr:MAG: hypothetical protein B9S36_05695 [Verrucomicrobiae bacterium Tous-C2TDCM]